MSRMEEYKNLLAALDTAPHALDNAIAHAEARVKKSKRVRRLIAIPGGSIAVFLIAFIVLVNVSATFALACSHIPVLRELATAVAFSPSLTAAVENDYVQPIGLEQTDHGVTMRVEYVIVDQKQLNIFYTLDSVTYTNLQATPSVTDPGGARTPGVGITTFSGGFDTPEDTLRQISVDFTSQTGDMPDSLVLMCALSGRATAPTDSPSDTAGLTEPVGPDVIANFSFTLNFDPAFTRQGEDITLNKSFVLDGQSLTVTTVEVYPTHIRLNLTANPKNTAWLKSLTCSLKDEKGKQFNQVSNGVTATGEADSPMMSSYRLESSYFSDSKKLTLNITGAVWLDKGHERIWVNLAEGTAENLPQGVKLNEARRTAGGWQLSFTAPCREENAFYQLFFMNYYDEMGKAYSYNTSSSGSWVHWDESTRTYVTDPDIFQEQFTLDSYSYDTVYLSPAFSRAVALETPIVIGVK